MVNLNKHQKWQSHSDEYRTMNIIGDIDFAAFDGADALAGDTWRMSADEQTAGSILNNIIIYKGDKVMAMVDNPGTLNWENINNGNWDISRKIPITPGTRITARDGGQEGVETYDDDYRYICVQSGIPESLPGRRDGTAIWKKSILLQSN